MSDLLPEWGIKLRNMLDRVVPVVQTHHAQLHELEQTVKRLEAAVAQQQQLISQLQSTMGVIQAERMGTGPTSIGR